METIYAISDRLDHLFKTKIMAFPRFSTAANGNTTIINIVFFIVKSLALACYPAVEASAEDALVKFQITGNKILSPLTESPGNAVRGRIIAAGRDGNCLACHRIPIPEEEFHGNLGPALSGTGSRFDAGELRLRLVNPRAVNPDTIMPAFYKVLGLQRVAKRHQHRPILTGQQIEDVVAYLLTLTNNEH